MPHTAIYGFIRVSSAFGAEFPYCPVLAMFIVEEFHELVERISVGELGVGLRGAGSIGTYPLANCQKEAEVCCTGGPGVIHTLR